jgi:PAS domain S-box-containing protein
MIQSDSTLDFRGLFEASPGFSLLLTPDRPRYTIIAVSDAYARAVNRARDQIVGRGVFDVLACATAEGDGLEPGRLRAALDAVVRVRAAEATPPGKLRLSPHPATRGQLDDRWWRTVNAPVLGPDGELRYIIHQAEDVTDPVRRAQAEAEARWAFQLRLSDALRVLATPLEVQSTACQMLGEHLGVNRVHFAEIEGDEFVIRTSYVNGVDPFEGRGPIATFGAALLDSYRRGEAVAVPDVERDPRFTSAERARLLAAGTAAFAGAILTKYGRWVASVGAHSVTPRRWTRDELALITHVADRIWTAAERARTEAALRESEARYGAIFEESPVGIALTRWSDRVTVSANPAFLRMLELDAGELLGKTSVDLGISTPEQQAQVQALLESRGSVRDLECRRTARSGSTRILSLNIDWVFVAGEKHVLTTVRDLTELRRAEEATRRKEQERLLDQARAEVLGRSEARYSGILQTSADAIVSVDDQLRITLFNKAAEQAFGHSQHEVINASFDLLVPPRLRAEYRRYLARFAAGDQPSQASERTAKLIGLRKDGEEFPAEATLSKITIDGKALLTAALRDITSKLRTDIEQRLFSEIGSALASRIDENLALTSLTRLTVHELADLSTLYLVAEDGSVQRHGVAFRDPAAEWLTELIMNLPIDRRSYHPLWQILDTRRSLLLQLGPEALTCHAITNEQRRVLEVLCPRSVIGVPLLVGEGVLGALFVASCRPSRAFDARDVRVLEEVARRVALSLENARLYRAAREAIQVRDDVLGIVAHDLRSPLGAILMQTSLTGPRPGQPERRSRRAREAIERSVTHMNRMINDLLEVARVESGYLDLVQTAVAPADLVAEVVEAHRERAAAASIELRAEVPPGLAEARADRDRLLQVFENLLGNAMRIAPGTTISLGAGQRAGEILFWVADTGPGIAPEDLPHVFDRFWQARKCRRGGAGLGLAIVKAIVESHAGRVWLESKLGAGTTVFFTVPMAETAPPAGLEPGPPAAPAA